MIQSTKLSAEQMKQLTKNSKKAAKKHFENKRVFDSQKRDVLINRYGGVYPFSNLSNVLSFTS